MKSSWYHEPPAQPRVKHMPRSIYTENGDFPFKQGLSIFVPLISKLYLFFSSFLVFPQFSPGPCLKLVEGGRMVGFPFS
jgi:hypothetical protein